MSQQQQQQKQVSAPPVWFDLTEISPNQALLDIEKFTNRFENIKDTDFIGQLYDGVNAHYSPYGFSPVIIGYIPAPPKSSSNSQDVIKKVIGTQGYWLKKTTRDCGLHFIWYEPVLNNFLFWAPNRFSIVRAMKAIRWRIIKYWEFTYKEDDFSDMPELISQEELDRIVERSNGCTTMDNVEYYEEGEGEEEVYNEEDEYNQREADAYFMGQRCNWDLEGKRMVL
jgi:hypothetical protein